MNSELQVSDGRKGGGRRIEKNVGWVSQVHRKLTWSPAFGAVILYMQSSVMSVHMELLSKIGQ